MFILQNKTIILFLLIVYTINTLPVTNALELKELEKKLNALEEELNIQKIENVNKIAKLNRSFEEFISNQTGATSRCGTWDIYKDEKCFKAIVNTVNQSEAESLCIKEDKGASLAIIHSIDEQEFVSNLLFNTMNIQDNVWIGAKYSSNSFQWTDDSTIDYNNWAQGKPVNNNDEGCVQMIEEAPSTGKWSDASCTKHAAFICQKKQTWPNNFFQDNFIKTRKSLTDTITEAKKSLTDIISEAKTSLTAIISEDVKSLTDTITEDKKSLTDTISEAKTSLTDTITENSKSLTESITDLVNNPVPIGFIYVQLPAESEPKSIWPNLQWEDITSNYAGLFFRAEGGDSETFGYEQYDDSPRLVSVGVTEERNAYDHGQEMPITAGERSANIFTGCLTCNDWASINFEVSGGEVRPRNKAIRIWKRTE